VELIVFWDYLAPSASALAGALTALRAMRPVREAALHLPLADARPLSFLAAIAVEAARAQGEFWAAHDRLLTRPPKNERAVFAAAELVQDPERFRTEVAQRIGHKRILEHVRLAAASGVHTVPAVFIGGARYDGEHDPHELASAIDRPGAHRWQRRIPQPDAPGRRLAG
jgi:protein-disulfide isomerase